MKDIWTYLNSNKRTRTLTIAFIISGILHGLSFAALIPLLRAVLHQDLDTARPWMILICVLGIAAFCTQLFANTIGLKVSVYDMTDELTDRIGRKVSRMPLGEIDGRMRGQVSSAITSDINRLSHLPSLVLPNVIYGLTVPAILTLATLALDWRLGAIMLAAIPVLMLSWRWLMRVSDEESLIEKQMSERTAHRVLEYAKVQPVLRAADQAGLDWPPIKEALAAENQAIHKVMDVKSRPLLAYQMTVYTFFALVLAAGLALVMGHHLDVVGYLVVGFMAARTAQPLSLLAAYASEIHNEALSLRRVNTLLSLPELPEGSGGSPGNADIEFSKVGFGYLPDKQVLSNVNFKIPEGSITALVGPSGSGKSTITRLIARFWDVTSGSITIGGVDIRNLTTAELMDRIAMVFQEVYLFDTTILDNVRIAKPNATDEEVLLAAKRARLDRAVHQLPDGWQTRVGESGQRLSGGERQRVAIARAFLKDAPILVLDEITSALDGENEAVVTHAIKELAENRTVLVVAHRLTTIMSADQIIVLAGAERGGISRIVQQGTPDELSRQDGIFADYCADSIAIQGWQL